MIEYSEEQIKSLNNLVEKWVSVDINPKSKKEIIELQNDGDYAKLDEKLSKRIAFGTAGLRSAMTSGFAHMNDVTILQASQGLIKYLLEENESNKDLSIVVGYDHRHHSQRFAEITASVALTQGFKVYYLGSVTNLSQESIELSETKFLGGGETDRGYVHTPLVPFAIDYFKASAGVMVTASHNPAQDNGYKVYYGNGCQIIPPNDIGIAQCIERNLDPWLNQNIWDVVGNFKKNKDLLFGVKEKATEMYIKSVYELLIQNKKLSYDFTYTPMHGVGMEIFNQVISLFDTKSEIKPVTEQMSPDPEFLTVKFPNPEEKGALDLSIKNANELDHKLVLANDPDADRFSVAIKTHKTNEWVQLTGNEIGFLFAMYVIEELTPKNKLDNTYLINSTVSSQILASMAQHHGFNFIDTLTGFKWIGNKAIDLKKEGFNVPFGYEEAIGFMFGVANDKDGISALVMWLQLYEAWFANKENYDPVDKLNDGYKKYGWYKEANGYYKLNDLSMTQKIFDSTIRKSFEGKPYPETLGESFLVDSWRDLTIGYDSLTSNNKPVLPVDPTSQMITAILKPKDAFSDHELVRFTCRGSGTEPKLKIYIEGKSDICEDRALSLAKLCWNTLKAEWFKPEENGLQEVI
ncbi:uncharacterized protein AC631_01551 [Debaryomyces fabryi]|uniref:Phosphoribomutase n=1 Tax=Debaryomyces fabryi TaxID=58627 RepID=A0A0V1Q2Q9_9ASCO|nr:uncharacterized protein AC631_01551 [Debaryomyces fabryi]KSA02662.1 hypothetical protein AC631_01551 [Debaryomyces fabryi]CUM45678.1 unnamed protein product [Debaryomyces fabryi]